MKFQTYKKLFVRDLVTFDLLFLYFNIVCVLFHVVLLKACVSNVYNCPRWAAVINVDCSVSFGSCSEVELIKTVLKVMLKTTLDYLLKYLSNR